jgi:hypothetical protein
MDPFKGRKRAGNIISSIGSAAVFFSFLTFITAARAEQPFHIMGCSSGSYTSLSESKALTVFHIMGKGISWGVTGIENFNHLTWQFVAVVRIIDGITTGMGYYKFADPDGDYFILEGAGHTVLEGGTWKFVNGTGKWKGICGGGKSRFVMRGRPLSVETEQYWCRIIGTLELPD